MFRVYHLSLLAFLGIFLSGCLKTRAQLKDTDGTPDHHNPVPAQVQPVSGSYEVDEIRSEITSLNGRITELERNQSAPSEKASSTDQESIKRLESRIGELERTQLQILTELKAFKTNPKSSVVGAFESGKAEFKRGKYQASIRSLDLYLDNPKAQKYRQEATFLRAEANYNLKNYKKAILDYSAFQDRYTKSKYRPAALLKIGLAFEAMGNRSDARAFFQEAADKYPKTSEGKKARTKLK